MKIIVIVITMFLVNLLSGNLYGQVEIDVQKEVEVEMVDGVKTVIITTTTNGVERIERFTGDEAENQLAQLEGDGGTVTGEEEIEVKEINGKTTVIIRSIVDGQIVEEVYEGEEAEQKVLEWESKETKDFDGERIIKVEKEIIKED